MPIEPAPETDSAASGQRVDAFDSPLEVPAEPADASVATCPAAGRVAQRDGGPGFPDLGQPLCSMTGIVDVPARTGNRPAALHRFQAIHDSREFFDEVR